MLAYVNLMNAPVRAASKNKRASQQAIKRIKNKSQALKETVDSDVKCPPDYSRTSPHVTLKSSKTDVIKAMSAASSANPSRAAKKADNVKRCIQCHCYLDESKYGTKMWKEDNVLICNKCIRDLSSDLSPIPVPFIDSISLITSSIQTSQGLKLASPNAKTGTVTATCSNHISSTPGELEPGEPCNLKVPVETSAAQNDKANKVPTNVGDGLDIYFPVNVKEKKVPDATVTPSSG